MHVSESFPSTFAIVWYYLYTCSYQEQSTAYTNAKHTIHLLTIHLSFTACYLILCAFSLIYILAHIWIMHLERDPNLYELLILFICTYLNTVDFISLISTSSSHCMNAYPHHNHTLLFPDSIQFLLTMVSIFCTGNCRILVSLTLV